MNDWRWDLAEWFQRLTSNAKAATVDPSIFLYSGIWGAADEAVLNKVLYSKDSTNYSFH